jgi:hypothetical protein
MPLVILSLFNYEHTFLSCDAIWQMKDNINVFAASKFFITSTYDTFQPYKIDIVVDSLLNSQLIHKWCTDYIWNPLIWLKSVQENEMIHFNTRTLIIVTLNVVKTITQLHNL